MKDLRQGMEITVRGMLDGKYWSGFSADFSDYELGPPIGEPACRDPHDGTVLMQSQGFGASSTVYSATYHPASPILPANTTDIPLGPRPALGLAINIQSSDPTQRTARDCAIKISSSHADVGQLFKETRLLGLCRHPNVLR